MGRPTDKCTAALYNLKTDVAEKVNVISQHPQVVERLTALAAKARADIGDYRAPGSGQRKPGWIEQAQPLASAPKSSNRR